MFYFDESGLSGVPEVPYGWVDPEDPPLLPSGRTQRLNILGFMNRQSELHSYVFESSITSDVVIACFDEFSKTLKKPSFIVLDNASIHRSGAFQDEIEKWEKRGLFLYYLPAYSPELNLIEILWKHIKYYWIPLSAFDGFAALRTATYQILARVGDEYKIEFQ